MNFPLGAQTPETASPGRSFYHKDTGAGKHRFRILPPAY